VLLACTAAVVFLTTACGSNPKPKAQAAPAQEPAKRPAPPIVPSPPPSDPIATLIANSQGHFESGERELRVGHLESARAEFDRAVDILLESPYGARTDARLREHFDRLVDRINAYEVTAPFARATASRRRKKSRRPSTSC
jgi:membrane-bound lytic murein transglycosylase D